MTYEQEERRAIIADGCRVTQEVADIIADDQEDSQRSAGTYPEYRALKQSVKIKGEGVCS